MSSKMDLIDVINPRCWVEKCSVNEVSQNLPSGTLSEHLISQSAKESESTNIAMFTILSLGIILCLSVNFAFDWKTPIKVSTQYREQLNVKIQGAGVGGCDIILNKGDSNSDCWCLWGTLNYSFCAYKKAPFGEATSNATEFGMEDIASGRCPAVTGESLVCSDLNSLGNCYDNAYFCTVNSNGLCHCESV